MAGPGDVINNSIYASGPQVVPGINTDAFGSNLAPNIVGSTDPFSAPGVANGGGGFFGSGNSGIFGTGASVPGGVSSIFSGIGSLEEASSYKQAASIAASNALIAKNSGQVQESQMSREFQQVMGKQAAQQSGAGLRVGSGVAGEVARSSAQQGNLAKQLINLQTDINVNGFEQEATQYKGMANAATASGIGGIAGGILGIFGI